MLKNNRKNLAMFKIGNLELISNLFLSPLAGYTNLPFRIVIRKLGGLAMATTDLVNARSLVEKREKAFKLIETHPDDYPLAAQLFGKNPEEMRDAAIIAQEMGLAAIDINMGCPVRKVCSTGGGAALLKDFSKAVQIADAVVKAVKIPVTAKTRLGWDAQNIIAPELACALEDVGIKAIFIHGRTREQGFGGKVNLEGIRSVVQSVKSIPVIGNGDITTPQAAKIMIEKTGCAGVSIGRGAFYNPWIFKQTYEFLNTNTIPPEPTFEERIRLMTEHFEKMIEIFGENYGCRMFRKIIPMYARGLGPNKEFIKMTATVSNKERFYLALEFYRNWRKQFLNENGELKPQYRPSIPAASFLEDNSKSEKDIIVPNGPVEYW
ncbi:MAG TPA: tRNA dihydrouridine synthase DusB [Verrucomicrobiota bacterium]|nr:tRNA dihydrouridine synthase DusB [Verrucomicrobiota bacterium]